MGIVIHLAFNFSPLFNMQKFIDMDSELREIYLQQEYLQFKLLLKTISSRLQTPVDVDNYITYPDFVNYYMKVYNHDIYADSAHFFNTGFQALTNTSSFVLFVKDVLQYMILKSLNSKNQAEVQDAIADSVGWFAVYKVSYPTLVFKPLTISKAEVEETAKHITEYKDDYNMSDKQKRLTLQALGLLIEQKVCNVLNAEKHNNYNYDFLVEGKRVDVKSTQTMHYHLPYKRFLYDYDYILLCRVRNSGNEYVVVEYNQVLDKQLLDFISIKTPYNILIPVLGEV